MAALVGLVVLVAGLGWVERGMRRVDNSYTKKRRGLEKRAADLEVLVLGPSGAMYSIDPAQFHAVTFNAGDVSQSIHYNAAIAERYAPRMPHLRLVIFTFSLASMETTMSDGPEAWRQLWYLHFWDLPPEGPLRRLDVRRYSVLALYPPYARVSALVRRFKYDAAPLIDENGWYRGAIGTDPNLEANGLVRAATHASVMRPIHAVTNAAKMSHVIEQLKARGIATALVLLPVSRAYSRNFDQAAKSRNVALLEELASKSGAQFANYLDDPRFQNSDFFDADHLNATGAKQISQIIDADIVGPAARR